MPIFTIIINKVNQLQHVYAAYMQILRLHKQLVPFTCDLRKSEPETLKEWEGE